MCGIAGSVNFPISAKIVNEAMLHRGPDEQNDWASDNVQFCHLRLSILDKEGGRQPMHLLDRYTIIFNGQIYNHLEIRKIFGLQGASYSDTETILMLYHKIGAGMLDYFDGMFAFAIYDHTNKNIFLARDRSGKKPLYIYNDGQRIVFASELNCLKALLPLQLNPQHFLSYLRLGSFYGEQTPYKNVKELSSGSYLRIDCNTLAVEENRWWDISEFYLKSSKDSFETALEKVDHMLRRAVRNRLESSDLEVGCLLSGGIDSGLCTAIASEYKPRLHTFTVTFPGQYNEGPLAKLVSDKYKTRHTEVQISFENLKDDVENILCGYGEPFFDSSAIPSFYVSKEAKKLLTVILNGDGADELFGGYRRYVPFAKFDFFATPKVLQSISKFGLDLLPVPRQKKSKYNFFYRLVDFSSKADLGTYLSAGVDIFEGFEDNILGKDQDYLGPVGRDFYSITSKKISGLRKIMELDFRVNLFNDLLVKMDIATMANSLEGRSPFLCKSFLEYVPTLKDEFKIKGASTKHLLRTLAKRYLPEELIRQPKRGFEVPLKNWVNAELKEPINDYLLASTAFYPQIIKKDFVHGLINNTIVIPSEKRAKILWTLFSLEVWYKKNYLVQAI